MDFNVLLKPNKIMVALRVMDTDFGAYLENIVNIYADA